MLTIGSLGHCCQDWGSACIKVWLEGKHLKKTFSYQDCPRALLPPEPCRSGWPVLPHGASHCVVQAWDTVEDHAWVCGHTEANICVDAYGSWYHGRPWQCHKSGLPPGTMLVSEGHTDLGGLCCHWGFDDVWAWTAVESHIWVHVPAAVGVYDDVHGPCNHRVWKESCMLKSKGCAKLAQPFTGPGKAGPTPHCIL